jgi:hypothetical protein
MSTPEYAEEQAMELEALESILADDLQGARQVVRLLGWSASCIMLSDAHVLPIRICTMLPHNVMA